MSVLNKNYYQEKMGFLDKLQPNDFRNGESFNRAGEIIDKINEAFYLNTIAKKNSVELLNKSLSNLFRENSAALEGAIILAKIYLLDKEIVKALKSI